MREIKLDAFEAKKIVNYTLNAKFADDKLSCPFPKIANLMQFKFDSNGNEIEVTDEEVDTAMKNLFCFPIKKSMRLEPCYSFVFFINNNSASASWYSTGVNAATSKSGDTVIVYDDVDLPTGTLRLREGGSGGTHNGMKNIIERAGTNAFKRIRLGIGGDRGELALADFVLMKVKKESRQAAEDMQKRAAEALTEYIRTADFQKIMRVYNAKAECTD